MAPLELNVTSGSPRCAVTTDAAARQTGELKLERVRNERNQDGRADGARSHILIVIVDLAVEITKNASGLYVNMATGDPWIPGDLGQ